MKNIKNDDVVIIQTGELNDMTGIIVNSKGPLMSVRLPGTKEVFKVHEEHIVKIEGNTMNKEEYIEFKKGIQDFDSEY